MMKKILLLVLSLMMLSGICFADAPEPTKKVVLFFKSSDVILQVQNDEEDIAKGKIELEEELKTHYSKRFIVDEVKFMPIDEYHLTQEYYDMVKPNQTPFIVTMELGGEGTSASQYQNAFGATATGVAPTVYVQLIELIADKSTGMLYQFDYGMQSYGAGTYSVGRYIYAAEENPRKNTKNSVRAVFRDACKYNDKINKYANPRAYEHEYNRFTGKFKEDTMAAEKINAPYIARIKKFEAWCNEKDANKVYLESINAFGNNILAKISYIDVLINMGIYKE
ncbi:MAG: hypothetical protein RR321_04455 [Acidaminococcaceae bacterium]